MDCINTQCFCRRLQRQVLWPTTNCGTKKCSAALDAALLFHVCRMRVRKWWNERGFCRIWSPPPPPPCCVPKWPPTLRIYRSLVFFFLDASYFGQQSQTRLVSPSSSIPYTPPDQVSTHPTTVCCCTD